MLCRIDVDVSEVFGLYFTSGGSEGLQITLTVHRFEFLFK